MREETKSHGKTLLRIILFCIFLGFCGVALIISGWNGLVSGEIYISRKMSHSFIATMLDPYRTEFYIEVVMRFVFGGILSLFGFGGLVTMLMTPNEKRGKVILAVNQISRIKLGVNFPWWYVVILFVLICGLLLTLSLLSN